MKIEKITNESKFKDNGIEYFWKCWGDESNFIFYKDCIEHSFDDTNLLPKFYLLTDNEQIIGSYALLTNDIISRQDLMPWFACLFVEENYRNQGLAEKLLEHGLNETQKKGFDYLYLSTDLINFYEKKGWHFFDKGYSVGGGEFKIYAKNVNKNGIFQ